MEFDATDFPFPPRFACHLRKRSSGLSGDDTISLGTVPPAPGCIDTPEYRWILVVSHPHRHPRLAASPAEPGLNLSCRASSGGAASCPSKNQRSQSSQCANLGPSLSTTHAERLTDPRDFAIHLPSSLRAAQGGGAGRGSGGAAGALHNARQDGGAGPGQGQRRSRSAALALPDANVPPWRRSGRPWVLFGSVGTCGRAFLSSSHTGCGADTAGVKILGL